MADHLVDSQPRHPDAGMDALIRHLDGGGTNDAAAPPGEPADPIAPVDPVEPLAADSEGEPAPSAEPEGEPFDEDPMVAVLVNGVEQEVPLSEVLAGYSRTSDYTRKTQAVAEERRALEAERSQLMLAQREAVDRAANLANQLEQELRQHQTDPNELAQLRTTDPAEYAARVADEQRRGQLLAQARHQAEAYQAQQQAQVVEYQKQMLVDKSPEFAQDFAGEYAALGRWVTDPNGGGVAVEDWNRETDHNRILIAHRAYKASQQNAAAEDRNSTVRAKVANLPRIRSGAPVEAGETERANYATAVNQMRSSGNTRDIARALQARAALKKR